MKRFWFDEQDYLHFCYKVPDDERWKMVYNTPEYKDFIEKERVGDPVAELKELTFHFHAYPLTGLASHDPTKVYLDASPRHRGSKYAYCLEKMTPEMHSLRAEVITLADVLGKQLNNMIKQIREEGYYAHDHFKISEGLYADYAAIQ